MVWGPGKIWLSPFLHPNITEDCVNFDLVLYMVKMVEENRETNDSEVKERREREGESGESKWVSSYTVRTVQKNRLGRTEPVWNSSPWTGPIFV